MENLLRQFDGDVHTKEALMSFIETCIEDEALRRMYNGEDVSHIKDAHALIEKAFEVLNDQYGIKTKTSEGDNEAR
jgi:hypothetical protein